MPKISEFYGIIIAMFYNDHNPPHFHAIYAGVHSLVKIDDGITLDGGLPPNATRMVEEWRKKHVEELNDDWHRAMEHQQLLNIKPLE